MKYTDNIRALDNAIKFIFDFVVAFVLVVIISPLFLIIALAIIVESKGPIFYRGVRVGRNGNPFLIYKFRSMVINAENIGASSTSSCDNRVTKVGRFIRKYKIDELSQLLNVLRGEMSIVGPRPEVQKFVEKYTNVEKSLLSVRPGITDWASIKFHNEGEIIELSGLSDADEAYEKFIRPEKLRLQLKYVQEHSILIDVKIIISTVLTLFSTHMGGRPIGVPKI